MSSWIPRPGASGMAISPPMMRGGAVVSRARDQQGQSEGEWVLAYSAGAPDPRGTVRER
jgi:hypothetical protein